MSKAEIRKLIELAKKRRHQFLLAKLEKDQCFSPAEIKELEIFEAGERAYCLVSTIPELARAFHVTTRAVDKWVAEGCPKTRAGNFDITEVTKWRMQRAQRSGRRCL